ncbi:MAG: chloride channel protein [Bacteroidetes bacterium]|nr:chloride channel protein [Bacteroidota bacterium]
MQVSKLNTLFSSLVKWILICIIVGGIVGSATALFLISLDRVTLWRSDHIWIVNFLPFIGLAIGLAYYYHGEESKKGNNLIIETHQNVESGSDSKPIPFIMVPLVFFSTLLTHVGGGSAGREGTAVQMGGAIADQLTRLFKLNTTERKTILIMGISAGFAAVFGTPIAGAIFALEIMSLKKIKQADLLLSIYTAYCAHYICLAWQVKHTIYSITTIPSISFTNLAWTMVAGLIFGLAAFVFIYLGKLFEILFSKVKFAPLRPFIGGVFIALFIVLFNSTQYIGLGIPSISNAFISPAGNFDFIIKIIITSFTLSAGFKGGEVTPLFFIGATLGNILIWFIPLPMALLAGMGFVAVFAGATNCIIASIVLGIELFGLSSGIFIGLACIMAYFTSGMTGIYASPMKQNLKYQLHESVKNIFKI